MAVKYVIDTSAFLIGQHLSHSGKLLTTYGVVKELDYLKDQQRTSKRQRKQLNEIVQLIGNKKLDIHDIEHETVDLSVLQLAKEQKAKILTTDIGLYIRQLHEGVKQEHLKETRPENILECIKEIHIDDDLSGDSLQIALGLPEFTYLKVVNGKNTRIGKYVSGNIEYIDKETIKVGEHKITPKCMEQTMMMDQIIDDRIQLVNQIGPAGSGKTFIAIQTQLYLVKQRKYDKIILAVPPVQLGGVDRYGFLPGSLQEKTAQQFSGFIDNISFLLGDEAKVLIAKQIQGECNEIEIQSFANIRGRSIKKSIVIIDEQQNTHPHELKTFLTRIDVGSKIILLGDIEQIDTKLMSNESNGLIYVADKLYETDVQTNILLTKTFRSPLAEAQIELL